MNKKVVIIGAGGHGKVIADIVRKSGDTVECFLDDAYTEDTDFYGSKILGKTEKYKDFSNCYFIIAIGNNGIREKIANSLDCKWYIAVHPSSQISDSVKIGEGTCVMANSVINADTVVGNHVIVNTASVIEHDCKIGDFCHISPKATICGLTTVGNNVWIGAGATVKNVLTVCDNTVIGVGASVVNDISESGTYIGVPAKKKK